MARRCGHTGEAVPLPDQTLQNGKEALPEVYPVAGGFVKRRWLDPSGAAVQVPSWVRTVSGSNGTKIDATGGFYNGLWLHLPISVPANYNPAAGSDWWQIEYKTNGTPNDTITISISRNGSPVHLVAEVIG